MAEAIKPTRSSSSPSMDGLPAAFYQVDPEAFGGCLMNVFKFQLQSGSRSDLGSSRPIASFLCRCKVLSKVLAHRLQRFLPKLEHQDEKPFVRGRSLYHHIRHLAIIQGLVAKSQQRSLGNFGGLWEGLLTESIGRTCFVFWKKWALEKVVSTGSVFCTPIQRRS
uniref:AlNc14C24G2387 protein n=1 Tax=Albugo laibachii Nc14 TaxID=890382 RepID=F0W688_9STRA|nr:AlNc14C24G2387 [Albugo laibachii Nc14]|eukprot:CCA16630.1 AlNc14C24G2387 [Albugo laibachii Nc14]